MNWLIANIHKDQKLHIDLIGTNVGYFFIFDEWVNKEQLTMRCHQLREEAMNQGCDIIFKINLDSMIVTLIDDTSFEKWRDVWRQMRVQAQQLPINSIIHPGGFKRTGRG